MTEDELLRTLDGGDPEMLLVCADWHEGNGNAALAELLRLEHRLRTKPRPRNLLEVGALATTHADTSPQVWLDKVAVHSPVGAWDGRDSDREDWRFDFHDDHKLSYTRGGGRHDDGEWRQIGSLVVMMTNNKFTTYVGLVLADRIIGAAKTIHDLTWTWEVMRLDQPRPEAKLRAKSPDRTRRAELARAIRVGTEARKKPAKRKAAAVSTKPAAKKPGATSAKKRAPSKPKKPTAKPASKKPAANR